MTLFRLDQAALVLLYSSSIVVCWNPTLKRREALQLGSILPFTSVTSTRTPQLFGNDPSATRTASSKQNASLIEHPFHYADDWVGTKLPILSLEEAANKKQSLHWEMGKWPDPILRMPAALVDMDQYQGTELLHQACDGLRATATVNGAVGLAAQQCGINARLIYLQELHNNMVLVNPKVVARSPEPAMRVWRETCLVFPPSFRATVLRDAWVSVEFQDWTGTPFLRTFHGETARAFQHEMDHDRGILISDHIDEAEMENDVMRAIERPDHEGRMRQAYQRYVD
jgi:peptide deformylase